MANPQRGEVLFDVGGVSYTLCVNYGAMAAVEGVVGRPFTAFAADLGDPGTLRVADLIVLFWAGLQKFHPDIDRSRAADIMQDIGDIKVVVDVIAKSMSRGQPVSVPPRPQKPGRRR